MEEKRTTYTIYDNNEIGKVKISEDVIGIIAGVAATDVEGVASIAGGITRELILKTGVKKLAKGVHATVLEDGSVDVVVAINLEYGCNLLESTKKVQEKVKFQIEGMTGLTVANVNVRIASVSVPN